MRRLFPKPINCTEYNPRAIARVAAAQARMDADTDAYNRGIERIKNGGFAHRAMHDHRAKSLWSERFRAQKAQAIEHSRACKKLEFAQARHDAIIYDY